MSNHIFAKWQIHPFISKGIMYKSTIDGMNDSQGMRSIKQNIANIDSLGPHNALKHHFTDLILPQPKDLEWKFL